MVERPFPPATGNVRMRLLFFALIAVWPEIDVPKRPVN